MVPQKIVIQFTVVGSLGCRCTPQHRGTHLPFGDSFGLALHIMSVDPIGRRPERYRYIYIYMTINVYAYTALETDRRIVCDQCKHFFAVITWNFVLENAGMVR